MIGGFSTNPIESWKQVGRYHGIRSALLYCNRTQFTAAILNRTVRMSLFRDRQQPGMENDAAYAAGLDLRCRTATPDRSRELQGDEHAGFYSKSVYNEFAAFHDRDYGAFSRLVRSTFDKALSHFGDGTIDLLRIDGLHTYEVVRLPKLAPNAIAILHDTNVREGGFAVHRLWSEIACDR